jgi:hypothetical protein
MFTSAVLARKRIPAATWSSILYLLSSWLYLLFAALGSWFGAFASMTFLRRLREHRLDRNPNRCLRLPGCYRCEARRTQTSSPLPGLSRVGGPADRYVSRVRCVRPELVTEVTYIESDELLWHVMYRPSHPPATGPVLVANAFRSVVVIFVPQARHQLRLAGVGAHRVPCRSRSNRLLLAALRRDHNGQAPDERAGLWLA